MVHEANFTSEISFPTDSLLAQLVEHGTDDREVVASIPIGTIFFLFCSSPSILAGSCQDSAANFELCKNSIMKGNLTLDFIITHIWKTTGGYVFTRICLLTPWGGTSSGQWRGYPNLADGGTPQVRTGWGYPPLGLDRGTPHQNWMRVPPSWLDGVLPWSRLDGVPPHPHQEIRRQNSYAAGSMPLVFTQVNFLVDNIFVSFKTGGGIVIITRIIIWTNPCTIPESLCQ